jgi:hypothetical protein
VRITSLVCTYATEIILKLALGLAINTKRNELIVRKSPAVFALTAIQTTSTKSASIEILQQSCEKGLAVRTCKDKEGAF